MIFNFLLVQLIGFVAWIFLIISFYRKNTNKILIFQIIATILYCFHYYLLGAYIGMFICFFETLRDYLYYKTDIDNYLFLFSLPIYVIFGYVSFVSFIDLFPIFSSVIDGYSLTKNKNKVVFYSIFTYILWVIYNFSVKSYSCAFTCGLIVISNIFILLKQRKSNV